MRVTRIFAAVALGLAGNLALAADPDQAIRSSLKAIDPGFTDELVAEIKKRVDDPKEGGPFKDGPDFWNFVQAKGGRITVNQSEVPIVTSGLFSFRISSIGTYGATKKEIEVVVLDIDQAANRLNELVKEENKKEQPGGGADEAGIPNNQRPPAPGQPAPGPGSQTPVNPLPKGAPRIVYWTEK